MTTIVSTKKLVEMVGENLGPSQWLRIDQQLIDSFADATLDHQYIHCDPARAAHTPLGGTVAHGFLSLSLVPYLNAGIGVVPAGAQMVLNYGLDRVRFLQPVLSGSRVRLRSEILDVDQKEDGRILMKVAAKLELESAPRPAMIAETLTMFVF